MRTDPLATCLFVPLYVAATFGVLYGLLTARRMKARLAILGPVVFSLFGSRIAAAASPAKQEKQDPISLRMLYFERSQQLCRGLILSSPQLGAAFVALASRPLHEICECVATYVVSQTSDADIEILLNSADVNSPQFDQMLQLQAKGRGICTLSR